MQQALKHLSVFHELFNYSSKNCDHNLMPCCLHGLFFVSFHSFQCLVNNGVSVNAFSSDSPSEVEEEPGDSIDWSLSSLGEPWLKCFFNNY